MDFLVRISPMAFVTDITRKLKLPFSHYKEGTSKKGVGFAEVFERYDGNFGILVYAEYAEDPEFLLVSLELIEVLQGSTKTRKKVCHEGAIETHLVHRRARREVRELQKKLIELIRGWIEFGVDPQIYEVFDVAAMVEALNAGN